MSQFSTTGGRPAMHTGLDRLPVDQNPAYTDWKALGLDFNSPFDILSKPRAEPKAMQAPRKRGPKPSLAQRVIASLRDLPGPTRFSTDIMSRAESDRTMAIRFSSPKTTGLNSPMKTVPVGSAGVCADSNTGDERGMS
jgi:hypothetical protein